MNSKQTIMLIISMVLCLAVYPLYGISLVIMILTTASVAVLTLMSDKLLGIIPFMLSLAGALVFNAFFGVEYMIPGMLTAVSALAGFVMGKSIKGNWALHGVLLFSGGVFLLAIIITIFSINRYYDMDSINMFINSCKQVSYNAFEPYTNIFVGITPAQIKEAIDLMYDYITTIVPSILIISCGLIAYASFGIARFILKKMGMIFPMLSDRRHLIMTRGSGWIIFFVWILSLFVNEGRFGYALDNIAIIISALFFVCGVSLVLYLIEYKIKSQGLKWLLRILFFLSLFSMASAIISELLVMAALIDSVWNFRKLGSESQ